jgi:transmembrane sensor
MTGAGAAINEEAATWAVRLDAGPLREDEQRALDEWLARDPRHHGALIRARAQWTDLERLGALAGGRENIQKAAGLPRFDRRTLLAAGLAASAVAAVGAGWLMLRASGERYRTATGEMRRIALSDGSTLVLNTASEVLVRFEAERRNVILEQGEALFEVAHDRTRPFIVKVSDVHVRAVGTVFAVRLRGAEVDVTVSEGAVELAHSLPDASRSDVQRIAANEQSVIAPEKRAQVQKLAPNVVQRRLAWLDGRVAFDGEPLSQAVAEVNRHSHRRIVIDDPALEAQPIVGIFRATDAEGFCRVAAVALGATAVEDGDTIHLRMGESKP